MEMVKTNGFTEMTEQEMQITDGGIVIFGVVVSGMALLKIAGGCAALGITMGVTVGLNNKNRNNK